MNNRLEERLRAELPELAEALIADAAVAGATNSDTADDVLAPVLQPESLRQWPVVRTAAAIAAGLLVLAGIAIAADRLNGRDDTTQVRAASAPDSFGDWDTIADSPIEPRPYAVTAWTGSRVVFWAGSSLSRGFAYSDGAIYDPATDSWEAMVVPGWGHPGLTSAFFDGELYALAKGGGTRFDPIAGEWQDLPGVEGMFLAATVASDSALWGIGPTSVNPQGQPDLAIARYEPSSDGWVYGPVFEGTDAQAELVAGLSQLASTTVWTGTEIVIWRGTEGGIAFDPSDESWRIIDLPRSPSGLIRGSIAVATDDGLALLVEFETSGGTKSDVAVFEDGDWRWLETAVPFTDFGSVSMSAAGDWLVAFSADQSPVSIHLPTGAWQRHENAPVGGIEAPNTAWTGETLIVWGGVPEDGLHPSAARWTPPN